MSPQWTIPHPRPQMPPDPKFTVPLGVQLEMLAAGYTAKQLEQIQPLLDLHLRGVAGGAGPNVPRAIYYRPNAPRFGKPQFERHRLSLPKKKSRSKRGLPITQYQHAIKIWDGQTGWCRPFSAVR